MDDELFERNLVCVVADAINYGHAAASELLDHLIAVADAKRHGRCELRALCVRVCSVLHVFSRHRPR